MHALSTQASEKSARLFSFFKFGQFLAIALIWILFFIAIILLLLTLQLSCLLRGCILIVSKIDLTWPNQPGPCGTIWSITLYIYPTLCSYRGRSYLVTTIIPKKLWKISYECTVLVMNVQYLISNVWLREFWKNHPIVPCFEMVWVSAANTGF